jgi:CheY-like chemotaxis protein
MSEAVPLILLVENNDNDVLLFKNAATKAGHALRLEVVGNGPACMNYLLGAGRYRNRSQFPVPSLVLLDLGLPGLNGLDVLKEIREQPELLRLPVVVLTNSDAIRDVNKAYAFGANSFLVKPIDAATISSLVTAMGRALRPWSPCSDQPVFESSPLALGR